MTLDRFLLREVSTFLIGGLVVVILLLLAGALYEVLAPLLARGADPWITLQYLAFRIPEALVRGMPIAFLFAMLLAFSRMGEESELKALLSGGISPMRVLWPLLGLSASLTAIGVLASESLVPQAIQRGQVVLREAVFQKPRALIQPGSRFQDAYGRQVYIGRADDEGISEVRVITVDEILISSRATFANGSLQLSEGMRITYNGPRARTVTRFDSGEVPLIELGEAPGVGSPSSLTASQLRERIAEYEMAGASAHAYRTALYRKWAEPGATVSFAIFAVALAFYLLGGSRSLGMVGVVVLTFIYYATWSVARIMGEQGVLPPELAAWGPNALYALAGLGLFMAGKR